MHQQTGYLAHPFDPDDFARGIRWTLANTDRLAANARSRAVSSWSSPLVADQYRTLFQTLLASRPSTTPARV